MSSFVGALFLLAFEPFGVSILAAVSIGYLFILCLTQPPKIVAQCYFCFGPDIICFWIVLALYKYSYGQRRSNLAGNIIDRYTVCFHGFVLCDYRLLD